MSSPTPGRIHRSWDALVEELGPRRRGKKVVFTNGCFDILHVGHVRYLQEARSLGDILIVALNTDESVRRLKGPTRPIQNEDARAEIMAALGCVDYVTLFGEETPQDVIEKLRPDVLVKGGDYKLETIVGAPFVLSYGGTVKALEFFEGYSTTSIVEKMR